MDWFDDCGIKLPDCKEISDLNGLHLSALQSRYKNSKAFYGKDAETGLPMIILEIRLKHETLSCVIKNNFCETAYLFSDKEYI